MALNHHPVFDDILRGDLEAVKTRVLADPSVLELTDGDGTGSTPLHFAIWKQKPAIAHWLIEHRGQHDLETSDARGYTALHLACMLGSLSDVQALVAAGANLFPLNRFYCTPLALASMEDHSDIVAYLLQLRTVRGTIDMGSTLALASYHGHLSIVQLLLDAGADPSIPSGTRSPLTNAISQGRTTVALLLLRALLEPHRARTLHKARALLAAAIAVPKARQDAHDKGEPPVVQQQRAVAVAPRYLKGRV